MNRLAVIFALAAAVATSGCYHAAIPRFDVITHPVTTNDLIGRWALSTRSLESMTLGGFAKKAGQEFSITLRPDGSCSYRTVLQGRYVEKEGQWTIVFNPSDYYKNRLDFQFQNEFVSSTSVAADSSGMLLWQSWGDPDAGVDLVYRKLDRSEPTGPANGSSPLGSETDPTSSAASSHHNSSR